MAEKRAVSPESPPSGVRRVKTNDDGKTSTIVSYLTNRIKHHHFASENNDNLAVLKGNIDYPMTNLHSLKTQPTSQDRQNDVTPALTHINTTKEMRVLKEIATRTAAENAELRSANEHLTQKLKEFQYELDEMRATLQKERASRA
ncbi:hypothetical protein OQA88_3132 [Cercophora sp. LCS_1]